MLKTFLGVRVVNVIFVIVGDRAEKKKEQK